jgi:hypothetical protein
MAPHAGGTASAEIVFPKSRTRRPTTNEARRLGDLTIDDRARTTFPMKATAMRVLIRTWIVCAGVGYAGAAASAPGATALDKYNTAGQEVSTGNMGQALVTIDEGLAIAPRHLRLLGLKGQVQFTLRDYAGALTTYLEYLDAGPIGENKRKAQDIVLVLRTAGFLDITLANGPADVYLDSERLGVFCTAAPTCHKAVLPGKHKVIARRPGFEPWTGQVPIANHQTATREITLVENPSLLTVRVAQPGARVMVDDTPYELPTSVAPGDHRVVVSLAGHVAARREVIAHGGKPVELDVTLTPVVPIRVERPDAAQLRLVLDDRPVAIADGGLAVSPGAHTLVVRARGFHDARVAIPADRSAEYHIAIGLEPIPLSVPSPPSGLPRSRKVALVAGVVGVAAAAGGVVLGLQARQLDHDAYALCPSTSTPCSGAQDATQLNLRGQSRARQANLAYGVAGGAAIAAAVLWLIGGPASASESRVAVTPRLDAVAGIDVAVGF